MEEIKLSSPAFEPNQTIPKKYSCDGENPPLAIENIPKNTESLSLIVDDPDAPSGNFVHWVLFNISPQQKTIDESTAPGVEGKNSLGTAGYTGPCPPCGKLHHYHFKIYALNTILNLTENATKRELESAMKNHIIAQGRLIGLFIR